MDQFLGDNEAVRDPDRTLLCEVGPHGPDDSRLAVR